LYNAPKLYPGEKDRLLEGDEGVHHLRQGHIHGTTKLSLPVLQQEPAHKAAVLWRK